MYIEKMKLCNFRNYEEQEIEFIPGINLFLGNNAQGKTNIIEAIYVSAFGKSYRTTKDNELVQFEKEFCRIELQYKRQEILNKVEVFIDLNNKKIIKHNDVKVSKLSDHVGEILLVTFSPDSLDIVKGSPAKRRKFLDMICCQLSKSYLIAHQEYMKCLKIKNAVLKKEYIDKEYIHIIHEKMSEYIEKIVAFRKEVIDKLLIKARVIQQNITNGKEEIDIRYESEFIGMDKQEIVKVLDKILAIEVLRKSSLKGIQRDDMIILVNKMEVGKYGSQGQNRTAMLTLKLADFEVLIDEKEETPILLLDDIMSELDQNRIQFFLQYIEQYQSIVTTTDAAFVKDVENIKISKVFQGTLEK